MKLTKRILISLAVCLLLVGMIPFQSSALAYGNETDFTAIDAYVTHQMQSARIPGLALVVVRGDQIIYSKGYGQADPSGRLVTPQMPFIIGSISKPITALSVMQLVEAGKVELDAPVQRYIPWFRVADPTGTMFPEASAKITVRHLLYQTSGMPQPPNSLVAAEDNDGALERSVRSLATLKLVGKPGQSFEYSNGNYNTLGLIIQTVSGQSYENYIKQHIFAPLAMQNSYVSQDEAIQHGMASGYRWWFGAPVATALPYNRSDIPSGYIIASAEDMGHFLIAQLNGGQYQNSALLSADGIALTHVLPAASPYAMGWESVQVNGHTLINHDGGVPNFEASLFFDPQEHVGVYVAANICSALDTLSSPQGADLRDGPSVRIMAESVLSLVTNQPLPKPGPGHALLYLIFDLVLLALTAALIVSLARALERHQRLAQHGISAWSDLARRSGWAAVLHFALPALLLYLTINVPIWKMLGLYQPDLYYWLEVVALVLFFKGCLEISLIWRVFRQTQHSRALSPA